MDLPYLTYPLVSILVLALAFREEDLYTTPGEYATYKILRALSTRPPGRSLTTAASPVVDGPLDWRPSEASTADAWHGSTPLHIGLRILLGEWESLRLYDALELDAAPAEPGPERAGDAPGSPRRRAPRRSSRARGRDLTLRRRWNR